MMLAIVVLPVPGGPHKIMEGIFPFSMDLRNTLPAPVRCSCPTKSFKVCGRIRSANGAEEFIVQINEEIVRREWNYFMNPSSLLLLYFRAQFTLSEANVHSSAFIFLSSKPQTALQNSIFIRTLK